MLKNFVQETSGRPAAPLDFALSGPGFPVRRWPWQLGTGRVKRTVRSAPPVVDLNPVSELTRLHWPDGRFGMWNRVSADARRNQPQARFCFGRWFALHQSHGGPSDTFSTACRARRCYCRQRIRKSTADCRIVIRSDSISVRRVLVFFRSGSQSNDRDVYPVDTRLGDRVDAGVHSGSDRRKFALSSSLGRGGVSSANRDVAANQAMPRSRACNVPPIKKTKRFDDINIEIRSHRMRFSVYGVR